MGKRLEDTSPKKIIQMKASIHIDAQDHILLGKCELKQKYYAIIHLFKWPKSRRKLTAYIHTKTCRWLFMETLFIICKNWKQSRYSSVDM
jgi:hypothetical protein